MSTNTSDEGCVVSVNIGTPVETEYRGKTVRTAIFKRPVDHQLQAGQLGLAGDAQADRKNHGGIHQAIYVYFCDGYEYWNNQLNQKTLTFGQFGENLTIDGFDERSINIGDILQIGDAQLQVSQPRQPCYKLAMRMEIDDFIDRFLKSHRLGCYCRVLQEGIIKTGVKVQRVAIEEPTLSIWDVCRIRFFEPKNLSDNAAASKLSALSPEWKNHFYKRIKGTEFDEQTT